jgi:hypothetical protein
MPPSVASSWASVVAAGRVSKPGVSQNSAQSAAPRCSPGTLGGSHWWHVLLLLGCPTAATWHAARWPALRWRVPGARCRLTSGTLQLAATQQCCSTLQHRVIRPRAGTRLHLVALHAGHDVRRLACSRELLLRRRSVTSQAGWLSSAGVTISCPTITTSCPTVTTSCHTVTTSCHTVTTSCHTVAISFHTVACLGGLAPRCAAGQSRSQPRCRPALTSHAQQCDNANRRSVLRSCALTAAFPVGGAGAAGVRW